MASCWVNVSAIAAAVLRHCTGMIFSVRYFQSCPAKMELGNTTVTSLFRKNGKATAQLCTDKTQLIFWCRPSAQMRFRKCSWLVRVTPYFLEDAVRMTSSKMKRLLGGSCPWSRSESQCFQYFSMISSRSEE